MLTYILYFQFVFMYLMVLVIGLVVYGSDFDSITGWLYVTPLIVLALVHRWVWARRFDLGSGTKSRIISGIAALAGLFVYAPLHMDYWDEHSVSQALGMAVLGVSSYLMSVIAAAEINAQNASCRRCATGALALIGIFWLLAMYYPMIIVLLLGLVFILSILWFSPQRFSPQRFSPQQNRQKEASNDTAQADVIAKYTLSLLAIDIGCIIWDFQVNTTWAYFVGIAFIAAALGFYIRLVGDSERLDQSVYIAAIANFTLAVVWPAYLLWSLHAIVAGLCVGYLLPQAMSQPGYKVSPRLSLGWMVWVFMGLVLSNAWYANLQWAFTRLIVVLPFAVLGILYMKYRVTALKYHV
jgi:hypothetical protein